MKKSAFDILNQNTNTDSKIIASLERIAQAFRVLLWNESKEFSLSPIQIQVLIFLLHHDTDKRKVSFLAGEFNMSKATISETVKILEQKKLIHKEFEQNDARSYIIHLSSKGKDVAQKTSLFAQQIQVPIQKLDPDHKDNLLISLLEIIHHLNQSGVITIQRMCLSCRYYTHQKNGNEHFCKLMNQALAQHELRIDCPEHVTSPTQESTT